MPNIMATEIIRAIDDALDTLPDNSAHSVQRHYLKRMRIDFLAREAQRASNPEQLVLRLRFTDAEKKTLRGDGAKIYRLMGTTIGDQKEIQREREKPSFWYIVEGGDRLPELLTFPSLPVEAAIFPDPERFFVPDSFNKPVEAQERLAKADAKVFLGERLGLQEVTFIIPEEAATLTELTFRYLDETGVWLFGREYASAQGLDWVGGRTKNPTNVTGSRVADVGYANPGRGLYLEDWDHRYGLSHIGVVRLAVPVNLLGTVIY